MRKYGLVSETETIADTLTTSTVSESRFGAFAQQMKAAKRQRVESLNETEDSRIQRYFLRVSSSAPDEEVDPIEFWRCNADEFGALAELAKCILPVPATSAPVERVFSQAGIATCNLKNRTGPSLLKKKLMLQMNDHFF